MFSRKNSASNPVPSAQSAGEIQNSGVAVPGDLSNGLKDDDGIRIFDAYGREMVIPKAEWREKVLLNHIKKVWDQPDELYSVIIQSLNDGFALDMVGPAEHLAKIESGSDRAAVVLSAVYCENKRYSDSKRVLKKYLMTGPESSAVFAQLARVGFAQGDKAQARKHLSKALDLNPNNESAFALCLQKVREENGDAASLSELRRLAGIRGSWRAQVLLARDALAKRDLEEALSFYDVAVKNANRPLPADMLMQISGDLGNNGYLPEILNLVSPHFDVVLHGIQVGNNLIKANLDLGRLGPARELLDRLYAQQRPDWKKTLAFWDTELAKAHASTAPSQSDTTLAISMIVGDGPIWLPDDSMAAELFPAHTGQLPCIAFLGSTAEVGADAQRSVHQLSDTPGRISRALPAYFAETIRFNCHAKVRVMLPLLCGDHPAFILGSVPWSDAEAAQHSRGGNEPADFVAISHIKISGDQWRVEVRVVRTIDSEFIGAAACEFVEANAAAAICQLGNDLIALLVRLAEFEQCQVPDYYRAPAGDKLPLYLIRLEQLMAVRCSSVEGIADSFLTGEREIVDGNLHLCLAESSNTIPRLVLLHTLKRLKDTRPHVVSEYREKVLLLQKDNRLPQPAQGILDRMVAELYP
jgi:tetratricopeptide (TPR) repeat protein